MRVCLVTGQFSTPFSGVGTYARALATGLVRQGEDVLVVCPRAQVPPSCEVAFMPLPVKPIRGHARWVALAWAAARHLNASVEADVVHFLDAREGLWYRGGVPTVGTVHDYYFVDPLHFARFRAHYPDWPLRTCYAACTRVLERRAYRRLDALVANSRCTAARVGAAYKLQRPPATIPIELDLDVDAPGQPRSDSILFVGGNPARKGLDRLIRCLPRLRVPAELWVAGTGVPPRYEALARRHGVLARVKQLGVVHGEALRSLYRRAKLLALPGVTEAFGLAFAEAMASRCAVIGPVDGGACELIEDGTTGYLVPHDDDELLTKRIDELLADEPRRLQLTDRAAEKIKTFSSARMASRTREVYRLVHAASPDRRCA